MTFMGRLTNVLARRLGRVYRLFWRGHVWAYRRSGGRRFGRIAGADAFCLTVAGRKSGKPHSVMVILTRRDDDLIVAGSNAGLPTTPHWYLNLVAAGEADVNVGGNEWHIFAREVEGSERDECWGRLVDGFRHFDAYRQLTERVIPVAVLERAPR